MRGRSKWIRALLAMAVLVAASGAEAQNGNHRWSAFVTGRGGLFASRLPELGAGATDALANVSASLAYSRYTPSSLFTFSGWTSGLYLEELNFGSFSVSASGSKRVTPKATLRVAAGIAEGFNFQSLVVNGILFVDQGVTSAFATGGGSYDFSPTTQGSLDFAYNRFRFELEQEIDASEFVFVVPGNDEILIPLFPDGPAFPRGTQENVLDASELAAGLLAAEGAIFTEATTETALFSGGLSHQFNDRTETDVRLGYRILQYERPSLVEGSDSFATLRLNHRFNFKTDFSASYYFRRSVIFDPAITSHTALGRIDRRLTVPLRVEGSFGVTYYPLPSTSSAGYELIGGAALSGEYVRTAFHLSYNRRAQHSLGIGRFLTTDLADAGLSYLFSRDWSGSAFAGLRSSRGTFEEDFHFTVLIAGGNLQYRINEEFSVGGNYLFRRLERVGLTYDAHLVSAVLSFGKIWR